MLYFEIAIIILAGILAKAQDLSTLQSIPECARQPAENAFFASGCSPEDTTCLCKSPKFQDQLTSLVKSDCSPSDQLAMLKFSEDFCSKAGVPVNVPQQASEPPPSKPTTTTFSSTSTTTAPTKSTATQASKTKSSSSRSSTSTVPHPTTTGSVLSYNSTNGTSGTGSIISFEGTATNKAVGAGIVVMAMAMAMFVQVLLP